jgi:exopolysaccharide biosynthesis polyprenyl glycosylphosphotransferase
MTTTVRADSRAQFRFTRTVDHRIPHRTQLQKQGSRTLYRHLRRSAVRFGVLVCADVATFVLLRVVLGAVRDGAVFGGRVAELIGIVFPAGMLAGWQFGAGLLIGLILAGAYKQGDDRRDLRKLLIGSAVAVGLTTWSSLSADAPVVLLQAAFVLVTVWVALSAERLVLENLVLRLGWRPPRVRTVMIGPADECRTTVAGPAFANGSGYRVVGGLDLANGDGQSPGAALSRTIIENRAEVVVICGYLEDAMFAKVVEASREAGCELLAVSRRFSVTGVEPQLVWKKGQPLIELTSPAVKGQEQILKRVIDVLAAGAGLLLLAPLFALVALAIKLESRGAVFYGSPRWGRFGAQIRIWKFRTMVDGADQVLDEDPKLRAAYESNTKLVNDPRVTRVGRFLRRWSLDELPQLWNVLVGEMSLVGPRPKLVGEESKYGAALDTVLAVRPGITGLWQVSGRNGTTYDQRVALDVRYASHPSIWDDLLILLRTVPVVVRGTGAH